MKEFCNRIKMDVIISASVCIMAGIVLLLWPIEVTTAACKAIGAVIGVLGLIRIIGYAMNREERNGLNLALGMMLFIVGIWIFLRPQSIQSMLLIGIGVLLFVHGFEDLGYAVEAKRGGYESFWILFLMAIADMALGVVCIADCFGVISIVLAFVGAALIYDGIAALFIISRVVKVGEGIRNGSGKPWEPESELQKAAGFLEEDSSWKNDR